MECHQLKEAAVKGKEDRFKGYIRYNPNYTDVFTEEFMDERFATGYYVGLKSLPHYMKVDLKDERYAPMFEYAEKHHLPILIHNDMNRGSPRACAEMAANEMYDYLLNGNIRNSVNLPDIYLNRAGTCRLCVIHRNVPRMLTRILDFISDKNINVEHMINKNRGKYAVTIVDLGSAIYEETVNGIREMDEVVRVRVI